MTREDLIMLTEAIRNSTVTKVIGTNNENYQDDRFIDKLRLIDTDRLISILEEYRLDIGEKPC